MGFGRYITRLSTTHRPYTTRKLSFDSLEDRVVMDVSLGTVAAPPVVVGKHTYVPLEATDTQGLPVTYSVTSNNAGIKANVITTGRTLALDVSGKDASGNNFTGTLLLRLFEDKAPDTIARITQLVNNNFYNGLLFHRVVKGFVAQGGDPAGNGTGGTGTTFGDEFDPSLSFNSFGLLAMANSGDDTNNSQFFITDSAPGTSFPEHLNFNHTIFGQIVDGLDVFQKIMNTPVGTNDKPNTDVKITKAYLINDNSHVILDLSTTLNAAATGTLTIKATNAKGQTATQTAAVTVKSETTDDRAFLGDILDRQTPTNTPITFEVTGTDLESGPLAFVVRKSDFTPLTDADNVTATVTQLTNNSARITITPKTGFTGLANLKIGVTDKLSNPVQTDFDTQAFNLFVTNDPISPRQLAVVASANVNPGNVVTNDTPTVEFLAPAGQTVTVRVNGTEVGTATQQSVNGTDATYRFTLPANKLLLGSNTVTAVTSANGSSSLASAPLTLTFAPSLQQIYVVPGAAGETVTLNLELLARQSSYKDELGVYVVDDMTGKVNGVAPTASGYRAAVVASSGRQTIFAAGAAANATKTLTFPAGTKLAFYLVQNRSLASATSSTRIFFSIKDANADKIFHAENFTDRAGVREIYGFEDSFKGGDHDYNDLVFSLRRGGVTAPTVGALNVDVAGPGTSVKTTFNLLPTNSSRWRPIGGEVGIFPVLDGLGTIRAPTTTDPNRTLKPGDAGYAQAALSLVDKQVLFTNLDKPGGAGRSIVMAGGSQFGVYYVPRGTAQGFLANNPANTIVAGRPLAFFSFAAANPDGGKVHMRTFPNNGNPRYAPSFFAQLNDAQRIHLMGRANGTSASFSDFVLTYQQSLAT